MNLSRLAPTMFFLLILLSAPFFIVQTKNDSTGRVLAETFSKQTLIEQSEVNGILFDSNTSAIFPLLSSATNNFEYELILNFKELDITKTFIIFGNGKFSPGANNGIALMHRDDNAGKFSVLVSDIGFKFTSFNISLDTDYNIKFGRSSGNYFLNINGSNVSLTGTTSTPFTPTENALINKEQPTDTSYIYTYLSISENSTKIHEFLFNEGTGTTLTDNIGIKNGTLNNANWATTSVLIQPDRSYFDIMENARTAEYANVFGIFQIIREIPMTAQKIITGIERFYNWFPNPISFVEDRLDDMTFSDIGDSWWYNIWQRLRGGN
jgi:hypothetical protein